MTVLQGLQTRLSLAQLYVFADAHKVKDLGAFVEAVVSGGADLVQVKLRGLSASKREAQFIDVRARTRGSQAIVVIDDDLDVAAKESADAFLAGGDGVAKARTRLSQYALVGLRATSADGLRDAHSHQADFAVVGPVVKGGTPTPLLAAAVKAASPSDPAAVRWFADGGITPQNVDAVLQAGARRIGVGTALWEASDPQATAKRLAHAVAAAWDADPAMQAIRDAAFGHQPRATLKSTEDLAREGLLPKQGAGE